METQINKTQTIGGEKTLVGSLPYTDPFYAAKIVLDKFPVLPAWPQLTARGFKEGMFAQFSEALPSLRLLEEENTLFFDAADMESECERVNASFERRDCEGFAVSQEYAAGLYALVQAIANGSYKPAALKGQITGAFTFGVSVTDANKKPSANNPRLFEAIIRALALKAIWQIRLLKTVSQNVILFIDEPGLIFLYGQKPHFPRETALYAVKTLVEAIHSEGALCGLHCCGKTDWRIPIEAGVDILSYDAFSYFDNILEYAPEFCAHIQRSGSFASGIIPTSEAAYNASAEELASIQRKQYQLLAERGKLISEAEIANACIITPACGLGLLPLELAERIIELTSDVSKLLKG